MTFHYLRLSLSAGLTVLMTLIGCRPAVYEIIKPNKDRRAPDNLGPEELEKAAPTAAIEVIRNGLSVTKVRVNEPTTIQPTADTVDPDDVAKSTCPNPGIVLAQYRMGSEASPIVNRGTSCDTLSVPYTFTKVGDFLITMTVTSEEGETALASMTLHVIAENAPADENGGFLIKASPMIAGIGQDIALTGICTTSKAHQISWILNDGTTGEGANLKHSYKATGPYRIDATCRETGTGGRSWTAAVTVVIMQNPVTPPVSSTSPGYTYPGPGGLGGSVGQNTGSDRPGQGPILPPGARSGGTLTTPPGSPGPVGTAPKNCGIFIFRWSC